MELNQPQVLSVSPKGRGDDNNFDDHLTNSRVPLYRRNDNTNQLNQITQHELDMIMEKLDSRIKERFEAEKKQLIDCVEVKNLAALETYFSNSQTRKLPRKRY